MNENTASLSFEDFDESILTDSDIKLFLELYHDDPVRFARDICQLEIDEPQIEILTAVKNKEYVGVQSGHGIGKSCMTAVLILWWMSTRPDCRVIVTANTADQVNNKTWKELAKVLNKTLNKSWFEWTATKLTKRGSENTWFAIAATWSDNNFESFAGTHADSVLMIFDEASSIPRELFEVAEGALTTNDCKAVMFGNPTRTTGYFYDKLSSESKWFALEIDSRKSNWTNKKKIQSWLEEYGEDSDFFRIRVKGQFPKSGSSTFISPYLIENSLKAERKLITNPIKVLGIDVANSENESNDKMVFCIRIGNYIEQIIDKGITRENADDFVFRLNEKYNFDWIVCDSTGHGAHFHKQFKHNENIYKKIKTIVANENSEDLRYSNKTTESFGRTKEWLERGGVLPNDSELIEDIASREFTFDNKGRYKVNSKSITKKDLGRSPDKGDALCLTMMIPGDLFKSNSVENKLRDGIFANKMRHIIKSNGFKPSF